jgi:hypothetical protein
MLLMLEGDPELSAVDIVGAARAAVAAIAQMNVVAAGAAAEPHRRIRFAPQFIRRATSTSSSGRLGVDYC